MFKDLIYSNSENYLQTSVLLYPNADVWYLNLLCTLTSFEFNGIIQKMVSYFSSSEHWDIIYKLLGYFSLSEGWEVTEIG